MTDRDLIDATLRGDREAFGHLVRRYQRLVEAAAYCATGRHELVDDIVQDTFITAWRTIDRLRDAESLRSWLYGIARNIGLKARRKQARSVSAATEVVAATLTPLDEAVEREREREIATAIGRLPDRYRQPLVLFYYEQCSVKEVAAALAMQEDAAMQRLSRGRRKLGEALAARVEIVLESKPTRAALGAALLLLLPARAASAATSGAASAAAPNSAALAAIAKWAAGQWRLLGAVAGSAAAMVVFVLAVAHSSEVAAHAEKHAAVNPPPQAEVHAPTPPRMPSIIEANLGDESLHRNMAVASLDPVESCRRGASGLVVGTLGRNYFRREGNNTYYEPSDELRRIAEEAGDRAAETCGIEKWPELYVICEGTVADIRDGTINCYPYDAFMPNE